MRRYKVGNVPGFPEYYITKMSLYRYLHKANLSTRKFKMEIIQ